MVKDELGHDEGKTAVWTIVLLGCPGSGKGTQAERLVEKYGLRHIEMGRLLRAAAQEPTPEGKIVQEALHGQGKLAPLAVAMRVFRQEIERVPATQGVIFDGTPRRREEIDYWDGELPKLNRRFTHVIAISLSEEAAIARLNKRGVCKNEGRPLIIGVDVPAVGAPCPRCGSPVIQRQDQTPELIRARMKEYYQQTEPVLDEYRRRGILREINGDQAIEAVADEIESALAA